jgi:hypothetical protein
LRIDDLKGEDYCRELRFPIWRSNQITIDISNKNIRYTTPKFFDPLLLLRSNYFDNYEEFMRFFYAFLFSILNKIPVFFQFNYKIYRIFGFHGDVFTFFDGKIYHYLLFRYKITDKSIVRYQEYLPFNVVLSENELPKKIFGPITHVEYDKCDQKNYLVQDYHFTKSAWLDGYYELTETLDRIIG